MLKYKSIATQNVDQAVMKQLWQLRIDYFPIKNNEDVVQDWKSFRQYFNRQNRNVVIFSNNDEILGYYVHSHDLFCHGGKKAIIVSIKNTYMRPSVRGHPLFVFSGAMVFLGHLFRYGLRPMYCVGFCFPNSYAFVTSTFGKSYTLQENPPDFEKQLLIYFARHFGGKQWNDDRQVASYTNRVPEKSTSKRTPAHILQLHAHYESINPAWRQGESIVIAAPVTRRAVWGFACKACHRLKNRVISLKFRTP